MKNVKRVLLPVAVVVTLVGIIWMGQGSGAFPYPASSFMIDDPSWIYKGATLTVAGILAVIFLRRT